MTTAIVILALLPLLGSLRLLYLSHGLTKYMEQCQRRHLSRQGVKHGH